METGSRLVVMWGSGTGAGATVNGYEVSFRGGDSVLILDYGSFTAL